MAVSSPNISIPAVVVAALVAVAAFCALPVQGWL